MVRFWVIFLRSIGVLITTSQRPTWGWFGAGLLWLGIAIGYDFAIIPWPDAFWVLEPPFISQERLIFGWLALGWLIFTMATFGLSLRSYRFSRLPTARNRIFYWLAAFSTLTVGSIFIFLEYRGIVTLLYVFGAIVLTATALTPRLPSMSVIIRRVSSTIIILILEIAVYALCFIGIQLLLLPITENQVYWLAAVMTVAMLLVISPFLKVAERWVNRVFFGEDQDFNRILRDYSQSISHVLDMDLLTSVIVDLMRDVIGVDRGELISIEIDVNDQGKNEFYLKCGKEKEGKKGIGKFSEESAIVKRWDNERRSVTQTEIDLLPRYANLTMDERNWLVQQDLEIYIPIHAKDDWVGLLALGPKANGASYFEEDIDLLRTLADQTAVALQNIRLVDSLLRVNNEFRRAYSAMEEAHTKLQRLDRTKSDFISIASHELRTPLTKISGYSQMLLGELDIADDDSIQKSLTIIDDSAQRLHEIIESMLEVAKIDMQDLKLLAARVEIGLVLRRVCRGYEEAFQERNLKLQFDDIVNQQPVFLGDVEALRKAFQHVIGNAIKYTPDGGIISITARHLTEGESSLPHGGVEIIISDTGIGVDPRYKDLIFTKFYQTGAVDLHSSGKTKFKGGGPGLGLTIVRGIIQAHGGKVWIDSSGYDEEKMPGSSFHILLPLSES
jgi:signal transduction histidine kinase